LTGMISDERRTISVMFMSFSLQTQPPLMLDCGAVR
jgi:hypothetical protein